MSYQIPDDLAHTLAQLAMPGADANHTAAIQPTNANLLDELLKPYQQDGVNPTNTAASFPTPYQGTGGGEPGTDSPPAVDSSAPTASQPQSNTQSPMDSLANNAQQLLQALDKSNQEVSSLLEKILGMVETQEKNLEGLSRRADQLAKQIDSLKNP